MRVVAGHVSISEHVDLIRDMTDAARRTIEIARRCRELSDELGRVLGRSDLNWSR